MDREAWLLTIFLIVPGIILIGAMIYAGDKIIEKGEECQSRGGILLKSKGNGYICARKDIIIEQE